MFYCSNQDFSYTPAELQIVVRMVNDVAVYGQIVRNVCDPNNFIDQFPQ